MCGIVGIYSFKEHASNKAKYIDWCLKDMRHRGPDSSGIWQNQKSYITGFVRLAIQDISECGNQPMLSSCGNYCISFNGEIYNSEKFKKELQQKGIQFKSTGDTEVLLYALIHFGLQKVLDEFDGMYAFAFYNLIDNELVIARDRLGIKPLYIGFNGKDDVIFSSQYNHIINYENISNEQIDKGVLGSYLQLGYMTGGTGIICNTQLLPHGHYMHLTQKGHVIKKYFSVSHDTRSESKKITEKDIRKSVTSQLISDVPVGTFLSGGIDSTLITLLANKDRKTTAFTSGTTDVETDEKGRATWFAEKFNIPHFTRDITEAEVMGVVKENTLAYSEPFADFSSLPSLLISQFARKQVKVVLSGDGPDELFWGYDRNAKMIKENQRLKRPLLLNIADYLLSKMGIKAKTVTMKMLTAKNFSSYYYRTLFLFGSSQWVNKILVAKPSNTYFNKQIQAIREDAKNSDEVMGTIWNYEMNIHLQRILIKMDRASMYHSLEARVPYLSNDILYIAAHTEWQDCVKGKKGKLNIKQIVATHTGEEFVNNKKQGFLVPMRYWLRNELKDDVIDKVMNMPPELSACFNKKQLRKMLHGHIELNKDYSGIIWAVYSLVNWYNHHRHSYKKTFQ